ncbi:Co-chaperone [Malassezia cuniculi]|uniref:Co-chaperone n=1 Tax=Malassezia cuniculi TaxID=948313 RepID=A0AAF0EUS7_9BASI|nr:Co-chaperone [Malassezia cuniculi]
MSTWNKHYHWKTKGCTPWAKEWFTKELVGQSAPVPGSDVAVRITGISSFEGDVELGNRKGKLITIYDTVIRLSWEGSNEEGKGPSGTITFTDVSHEIEDNGEDYPFETEMSSSASAENQQAYDTVRKTLAPSLQSVFKRFRNALIDTHARDLGHDDDSPAKNPSESAPVSAGQSSASSKSAPASSGASARAVSTSASDVHVSAQLAVSQQDLWDLLTNSARIPMWSKSPAQLTLSHGASYSLFGGNITGSVVEVDAPNRLVQSWRVPQWPQGHFGKLVTTLAQGEDSTNLDLVLTGVPSGEEDTAKTGLQNYYIHGLKSMGLGTIL